jgi:hypothetical protein
VTPLGPKVADWLFDIPDDLRCDSCTIAVSSAFYFVIFRRHLQVNAAVLEKGEKPTSEALPMIRVCQHQRVFALELL